MKATPPLNLPAFDIPENLPPGTLSNDAWHRWVLSNRRDLIENGQLDRVRNDPLRRPIDVRFVLNLE